MLKIVGYWFREDGGEGLPDPQRLVDKSWEVKDRKRIVGYLKSGVRLRECLGFSYCRFPGGPPSEKMGNADLTDGVWLWPEGLWVYVFRYSVRLPEVFVSHMRTREFVVGAVDVRAAIGDVIDSVFWREWSRQAGACRS
jgi:hypothetical protein